MEVALFSVNVLDPDPGLARLNAYLQSHRILEINEYEFHCDGLLTIYFSVTSIDEKEVGFENELEA